MCSDIKRYTPINAKKPLKPLKGEYNLDNYEQILQKITSLRENGDMKQAADVRLKLFSDEGWCESIRTGRQIQFQAFAEPTIRIALHD
jgi:hypothetical protein